jgi:hypothetical protein
MLDVIFRAPKIHDHIFSSALVLPKYRILIIAINNNYVLNPLSDAYLICKGLSTKQLKTLKKAVHNNNKIRELCNGTIEPVKYSEIEVINADLVVALKSFCNYLYDEVIKKAPFYNNYQKIDLYYDSVVERSSICRCCGINKILTKFHSHRSALDHYLPRNHYPFNSLNFNNLMPICDVCNSKYKLGEDTLYRTDNKGRANQNITRVKAFYPYRFDTPDIEINIAFNKPYDATIEPSNIQLDLLCNGFDEEVETWDRVFGIKEIYKAECCTDEMRMFFEEEFYGLMGLGISEVDYLQLLENNKYGNVNFLKIPFLKAI